MSILPGSPHRFFNSIDLLVGDFRKGSSFALGESAFVLQDEPYQQRCPAIRHIDDIENRAKGSIKYRQESDLISQIAVDGFPNTLIKIFGLGRGVEIAVETSGVIMDDHSLF